MGKLRKEEVVIPENGGFEENVKVDMRARLVSGGVWTVATGFFSAFPLMVTAGLHGADSTMVFATSAGLACISGVGFGFIRSLFLKETLAQQLAEMVPPFGDVKPGTQLDLVNKSKKTQILLTKTQIHANADLAVEDLGGKNYTIVDKDATHTVESYLTKKKGGYLVSHKLIPNEATLWDLSADALVEVYGVIEDADIVKSVEA